MSEDAILDALDAMVTGFKRQTPDEWSPSGHLETRVTKKTPVFLRHWILWALWAPRIRLCTGEIEKTIIVITMTTHLLLFFLKGSCESSIEFVTGAHSAHSDHSRTNPGEIGGHLKTQVPNGAQCRSNAGDRASLALAKLACRWHLDHGEGVPRALCAGCRAPIDDAAALDLADGNLVHFDPDYRCLIAFGERWRTTARAAVGAASTDGQTGATGLR